jgi:hypothetical protein
MRGIPVRIGEMARLAMTSCAIRTFLAKGLTAGTGVKMAQTVLTCSCEAGPCYRETASLRCNERVGMPGKPCIVSRASGWPGNRGEVGGSFARQGTRVTARMFGV